MHSGATEDLNRAIEVGKETLTLPKDHPMRPTVLNNLGISYSHRATRIDSIDDLDEAIIVWDDAVSLTPHDHPDRTVRVINLSSALTSRFEWCKDPKDLERSIELIIEAIQTIPMDHPDEAWCLLHFGVAMKRRFELTTSMEDLDYSIALLEAAVDATPSDLPIRATRVLSLAEALKTRFDQVHAKEDKERVINAYEEVVYLTSSNPTNRIMAAYSAAILLMEDTQRASKILHVAVELLPATSPRSLNRRDQQDALSIFPGVASLAAAFSLEVGERAYQALRLLEIGRGVIASHLLGTRTDVSDLEKAHPKLGKRLRDLQRNLDSLEDSRHESNNSVHHSAVQAHRRHILSKEYQDTLTTIRKLPTFENFLLAPAEEEFVSLAAQGPIVVLNVSPLRSDALIVTSGGIKALFLPKLLFDDVQTRAGLMASLSQRPYRNRVSVMKEILDWIWVAAIEPVLEELGYTKTPNQGCIWPRVWWVPTGGLASIPLHAAGIYKDGATQTCLDRVISSYAPTIRALAYSRNRLLSANKSGEPVKKVLLISMPETPGSSDLIDADSEVAFVDSLLPPNLTRQHLRTPTKSEVRNHLFNSQVVHFAGHGDSHFSDPSQSKLLLRDWKTDPLSVADLTALKLDHAQLAYISACHAAENRSEMLLDESIHLTAACLLAGFSSVVGSLWAISDSYSVKVATDVYRTLCKNGTIDISRTAEGLHHAVRELRAFIQGRKKSPDDPLIWAPYVHVGL